MAEGSAEQKSKGSNLKKALLLLVILLLEAGAIVGTMALLGPSATEAEQDLELAGMTEEERIVEIQVMEGRLPNDKLGVTYLYDVEIYVQVKQRNAQQVGEEIAQFENEIRAELTAIWRASEPHHFQEPRLENLTRKVQALMDDRFGDDPETGESIIQKCVVVMGTGFRVDG